MVLWGESALNNHCMQTICSVEETTMAEEGQLGMGCGLSLTEGCTAQNCCCSLHCCVSIPRLLAKAEGWGWCECRSPFGCRRVESLWHKGEPG